MSCVFQTAAAADFALQLLDSPHVANLHAAARSPIYSAAPSTSPAPPPPSPARLLHEANRPIRPTGDGTPNGRPKSRVETNVCLLTGLQGPQISSASLQLPVLRGTAVMDAGVECFEVSYDIFAETEEFARRKALTVALEQSIEGPVSMVAGTPLEREVLATVKHVHLL